MNREGQYRCHLGDPPMLNGNPATHNTLPSPKFHNRGEIRSARFLDLEHVSPALPLFAAVQNCTRFAASLLVRSTSSLSFAWGLSCLGTYRRAPKARAKPAVTLVGIPTHLSVMHWPTSRSERFGRKIQRQISRLRAAAASGWRSAISAVTAIGRAMLSPRLSLKFFVVTPCATSRSFPNGSRRPF